MLRKTSQQVVLCWGSYEVFLGLFWVYSSTIFNILHESRDINVAVTKIRNVLGPPLLWEVLGIFGLT